MTIRRIGQPGLRTRMRLADRGINPAFLVELRTACFNGTGLEGGVFQDFSLRSTTAVFVYLTHSPVASQFENALLRPRGRMRGRTRATPPPKWGVMRSRKAMRLCSALSDRMTGRSRPHLSLREGLEKPPFPLALHRVGSVLAVKGSLRRFAPWTAPGRSERRAAYEGKGGGRAVGCEGERLVR